ncbi:hypothetical protein [Amycolatopsis sp. BJA-103]|uniref:hypothetical protein n=1 Tax=Amycolatopsis sp. BJA-103 TaxID=1911175 RepID=UPI000C7644F4|nr:hypothetical protein [Amycolatopsis sp. BJA-103]AUI56781.1 hypothetical protein BKN51_00180 [Amycolatopsis sp. BJA-103]PNE13102.1 hypothetical protein B1H26_42320 [Amycolatopsis sp. BJA-103]
MSVVAAYNFAQSGNIATDFGPDGHHLNLSGSAGVQTTGGRFGPALGKTGAAMPTLPVGVLTAFHASNTRAVSFWAYGSGTTWWVRCQVDPETDGTGTFGVLLLSGNMAGQVRDASQNLALRPQAAPPGAEQHWYLLAYDQATGSIDLYRDNVLTTPGPPNGHSSFAPGTALSTAAEAINLLESADSTSRLSELRFLTHVPDATERAVLMATPVGPPASGVKLWTGSAWTDTPPPRHHDGDAWQTTPAARPIGT